MGCPRGHRLGGGAAWVGYHHLLGLRELTCRRCHERNPKTASWCLIDPAQQVTADTATNRRFELVAFPPTHSAGVGCIEIRIDGTTIGDVDVALCSHCHVAVIEHVRTDLPYRRRGFGRVAVAAATARGPGYAWTTTDAVDSDEARAFWQALRWPQPPPRRCEHMLKAVSSTP